MRGAALCLLLFPFLALAQEAPARFELTASGGYRLGGEFEDQDTSETADVENASAFALVFNIRATANTQWEVFYARQQTELDAGTLFVNDPLLDLDAEYFQAGGSYEFDSNVLGRPYVSLTVGVSRFNPDGDLDDETFFAGSFGGGFRLLETERVGVRLDGRVYASLIESDTDVFCRTGPNANVCAIRVDGDVLYQWEISAGVTFRF